MTSKVAFLSDTHFGWKIDNIQYVDYIKRFYRDFFFPELMRNDIQCVIQFGDLLDNRKNISIKTLKLINEVFLEPLYNLEIELITIIGNHDTYYKDTNDLNSVRYVLQGYKNVTLYEEITEVQIGAKMFGFVPWINDGNIQDFERFSEMSDVDVVVGHFEFGGMEYQKGIVSERGMSTTMVKRFPEVYSGHYHISSKKGNILYLNTPYEMTFNDMDEEKGFYVYDTKNSGLEFLQNPETLFKKVVYQDEETDYDQMDYQEFHNSYVKVYVLQRSNITMYNRFIDSLYAANPIDISVIEQEIDFEEEDDVDIEIQSTIGIIKDSVETLTNVDNPSIIAIMDELYKEAALTVNE